MDDFFEKVYEVVRNIPPGRVTSYGAIARYIGSGKSARVVGWAMNKAHTHYAYVPAHRVVNSNGLLTGKHHFAGTTAMQELLESEGVTVADDRVVDFNNLFWDPSKQLTISNE